jgi:hypothetical protein
MIELVILLALGFYLSAGAIFAIVFLLVGLKAARLADQLDPVLIESPWSVRLLLFPGATAVWPFLLYRMFTQRVHSRIK